MSRGILLFLLSLLGQSADAQPFLNAAGQIGTEAQAHIMQRDQERVMLLQRMHSFHRINNRTAHKPSSNAQRLKYWIRPSTDEYDLPQTDSIVFVYSSNYGSEFDYDGLGYNLSAVSHYTVGPYSRGLAHSFYPTVKFDTAYCFTNGLLGSRQDTFYVRYSPEGSPIEQKIGNMLTTWTYNNRSLMTSEVVYDLDTKDSVRKYEFEYNQDGQLILSSSYTKGQFGFLEFYLKEIYRYADPNAQVPTAVISYFRDHNTLNGWIARDSVVINTSAGSKNYTLTVYDHFRSGSWQLWLRYIYTYDGDQLVSLAGLEDLAENIPPNLQDTTYHMVRTLNNDHLPVQSHVRFFYPQFQLWDTSVHTVTYNTNNDPVRVQLAFHSGGTSEHRYGYETYRRSSVSSGAVDGVLSGVYPNPAGSLLYVLTDGLAAGEAGVRFINTLGQQVHAASVFMPDNPGRVALSLEGVPPGHYRICLTDASGKRFYAGFIKL